MKKFNVLVIARSTVSTVIDVEAESVERAEEKALEEAHSSPGMFNWTYDDGSGIADPELGGCTDEVKIG